MGNFNDNIKEYDDSIAELDQKELEYKNRIDEVQTDRSRWCDERRKMVLFQYLNDEDKDKLLLQATKTGYSQEKINEIRNYFKNWNIDSVTEEVVCSLREVNSFIESYDNRMNIPVNKKRRKKGVFFEIGDFFGNDGSYEDDN